MNDILKQIELKYSDAVPDSRGAKPPSRGMKRARKSSMLPLQESLRAPHSFGTIPIRSQKRRKYTKYLLKYNYARLMRNSGEGIAAEVSADESDDESECERLKINSSSLEKGKNENYTNGYSLSEDEEQFLTGQPLPSPPRLPNVPAGYVYVPGAPSSEEGIWKLEEVDVF
jgi:hypothetical protein